MRLKHFLSVFLTLLTLSVGQMWGAVTALALPKAWDASDGKSAYTEALGCTFSTSFASDYGSAPKLKFNSDSAYLIIQVADAPDEISFNFKQNGTNAGTFKVQESTDGSTYTDALTVTWPGNGTTASRAASLNASSRYIKLVYVTKGNSTNAGVGGISITKAATSCTVKPTVGADLTSVSATANSITATVPISNIGGCNITENGLVYSSSVTTPTVGAANCKKVTTTACGATAANKTVTISDLACSTTYYVRGYATNDAGIQYTTNTKTQATSACPKYTVTLKDDDTELEQATAGASVTLPERDGCTGYTFAGWTKSWTSTQSSWTTTAPDIIDAGSYTPQADENLYPVYTKTEGGSGASVGTTMWAEDFSGYAKDDYPDGSTSNSHTGTTVYNNGSVTYTVAAGSDSRPKIFDDSGSGTDGNNMLIYKKNGYYTIEGISVGGASTLTLSFTKGGSGVLAVSGSDNITVSGSTSGSTITVNSGTTFDLKFQNTNNSNNLRLDDISVVIATTSNGSTTSYISVPNCCTPLGSINGSVSETQPEDYDKKTVEWTIPLDGSSQKKAAGAILKLYADNNNAKGAEIPAKKADYSSDNNTTSHTFEGLDPETKYWFTITLIGKTASGVTYCDSEEGTAVSFTTKAAVNTWTITYNANGENVTNMPDATYAQKLTGEGTLSSTVPVRPGYTFLGWDTNSDATTATYAAEAAISSVSANMNLYAIWEQRVVTLNAGSGSVTGSPLTPNAQGKVTLPSATPSNDCNTLGWQFIGWAEAEATGTKPATIIPAGEYTPAAKMTLYAVYSETAEAIIDATDLSNTTNEGKVWTHTASGITFTLASTNYCTYVENSYFQIGYNSGNYGTLASAKTITKVVILTANNKVVLNSGNVGTLGTAVNNEQIWTGDATSIPFHKDASGSQAYIVKMTITYTTGSYKTSPDCTTYTLSEEITPAGKGTVSLGKTTLIANEETTAEATPIEGYRFLYWTISGATMSNTSDGKSTDNPVTITIGTSDATITANFELIPSHKVYFYNGTTLLNGENGTDVLEGGAVAYSGSTPVSCDDESTTFAGWTTAKWLGKTAKEAITENTFYEGTLPKMGENNVTYYAVFCKNNEASALFEWEGGTSADLTKEGNHVTASGLGSDYAVANAPYRVKLDGTGDYIDITTTAAIGSVTVGVKMVGGNNNSSITVKESVDGEDFTDVETLSISGAQNSTHELSTTHAFASTSRVVRLYFTIGSNVGVGPITIMGAASKSNYMTTCLLDLGGINGTVGLEKLTSGDNAGKLQATWTMASKDGLADNGIIIKIYKDGETPTLVETSAALSKDATSYIWSDAPDYCSEYYATLTPVKKDNSYKDGVEQGKSTSNCAISGQYSYSTSYSHVAPKAGETVAENSCSSFSVKYEGTDGYSLPTSVTVSGVTPYSWENGVLSFDKANVTGNVTITINGVEPAAATLSTTKSALAFGTPQKDADVAAQKFRISGVALSAGTITITSPNAGFTVSPTSIEVTAGNLEASEATEITVTPVTSAVGVFDGNITISGGGASTTVALTMEVKEIYTVNWYVNGSSTPARTQSDVSGTALTEIPNNFSSATDCMDKEFMGWATAPIVGSQDYAPEDLITSTAEMTISGNADYYAVFATKVSEGGYEKVTDVSILTAGDKIVITNGGTQAMKAYVSGNNCGAASIELEGDKITSLSEGVCEFTLGGSAGAWTFFDGTYYIYDAGTNSNNYMKGKTTKDDACEWVIAITSGETSVKSRTNTAKPDMQYNSNNSIFSCYNNSQTNVTLYRKTSAEYSAYVTTCPHITSVTLSAGSADHGSISFEKGGSAVTSVRTDGGVAVEVDVIASLDEGYELTGLTLTSEDVTGADKNEALTKITIPAGEEGTLTITPTITLIPKYSITFANGGADGGSDPTPIADQYAGETITLPANEYTYTGHKFKAWEVTNNSTSAKIDIVDNKFTMPAANVTITATWNEIGNCGISFMVAGNEVATATAPQEEEYSLAEVTHPTVPGFIWVGWSVNEYADETDVQPSTIGSYIPEAGESTKVLYGIYSRLDNSGANYGKYIKVTSEPTDWSGQYLIVHEAGNKAMDGSLSSMTSSGNGIVVTIADGVVTGTTTGNKTLDGSSFTIAAAETNYSIRSASGKYIGRTGTDNGFEESETTIYTNAISLTNNTLSITSSGGPKLQCWVQNDNYQFKFYKTNQQALALYKKNLGVTKYTSSPVEKVTITFNANGGNGGCTTTTINKGSEFTICAEVPTKSHSDFTGWKNGDDVYVAGTAYTFNADITLTAQWEDASPHAVTYNANGATGNVPTEDAQYAGDQFTIAAKGVLTRESYSFQGWKYKGKLYKAGDSFTMPNETVEFVAQWKKENISSEKLTMITSASALANGMQIALGYSADQTFAMAGDGMTNSIKYLASVSGEYITLNNGVATYTEDVLVMTLEQVEGGWNITKDGEKYLTSFGNSNDDLKWDTKVNATVWTISFSGNNVKIENASNKWIQYNSSNPRFKTYGASSNMQAILLFGKAVEVTATANISDLGYVEGENIIASGANVTLTIDAETNAKSITAQNGATVVVEQPTTAENVVVEEGSKIVANAPTTTPTVYFATKMGAADNNGDFHGVASELGGVTNITLAQGGEIIYDLTLGTSKAGVPADPSHWHAFSLPFQVDAINGIYDAETGLKLTNEVNYAIMDYHGDIRANGDYGWKKYRGILQPGTFYLMTVDGNTKTFRFKATQAGQMDQTNSMSAKAYDGTGADTDKGWNGFGNPRWIEGAFGHDAQYLDPYTYEYITIIPGMTIPVGLPFFYKASTTSDVQMDEVGTTYAPARSKAYEIKNVAIRFGNEESKDKLYISASEDALNEYEQDKDLVKMFMSQTPNVARISGKAYGMKLAKVYAPMANDQAEYSLTLYAPQAGEYTISVSEVENADIYLTHEGTIIWNLSMGAYTNDFAKGNTEGYGLLLVKKAPQVATGVDSAEANEAGVQKVIIEDKVFILRGGQMYDVTGKAVR